MARVAWIGLGVMGYPMAGHLARAGHEVTVYNRTAEKAERWVAEHGGHAAPTPREAARDADFVLACVGNDEDLRQVTAGDEGAFHGMKEGAVFVDHTTASADVARELHAKAAAKGLGFIDAPVSGGQAGAENGQLTVMCGGDPDVYEKAAPIIAAYARMQRLMGPAGSGQLTKMVNQICIGGISKGAAQSWQMENRYATMAAGEFDFGFAVDWMRKDFAICLEEARRNGARLPVTALVDQFYAQVQAMGGGRWDTSSLIALLEREEERSS